MSNTEHGLQDIIKHHGLQKIGKESLTLPSQHLAYKNRNKFSIDQ